MCDVRASGITGDVADSYLARVGRRPNGGVSVLWTDEPDQAMVFDDAAAAAEFCRDSALEMFVVSFVPASGPPSPAPASPPRRAETEAEFRARLSRVRAEAEARVAARRGRPAAAPEPPAPREGEPDLSRPGGLAGELRAMGLM